MLILLPHRKVSKQMEYKGEEYGIKRILIRLNQSTNLSYKLLLLSDL